MNAPMLWITCRTWCDIAKYQKMMQTLWRIKVSVRKALPSLESSGQHLTIRILRRICYLKQLPRLIIAVVRSSLGSNLCVSQLKARHDHSKSFINSRTKRTSASCSISHLCPKWWVESPVRLRLPRIVRGARLARTCSHSRDRTDSRETSIKSKLISPVERNLDHRLPLSRTSWSISIMRMLRSLIIESLEMAVKSHRVRSRRKRSSAESHRFWYQRSKETWVLTHAWESRCCKSCFKRSSMKAKKFMSNHLSMSAWTLHLRETLRSDFKRKNSFQAERI